MIQKLIQRLLLKSIIHLHLFTKFPHRDCSVFIQTNGKFFRTPFVDTFSGFDNFFLHIKAY